MRRRVEVMNDYIYYIILFIVAVLTAVLVQEILDRVFPMKCRSVAECVYSWEIAVRTFICCLVAILVMFGVAYLLWVLGLV